MGGQLEGFFGGSDWQETQVQSLGWEDPFGGGNGYTPVFLPGEFHGQKNLAGYSPWGHKELGYSPWGHKELDMTE